MEDKSPRDHLYAAVFMGLCAVVGSLGVLAWQSEEQRIQIARHEAILMEHLEAQEKPETRDAPPPPPHPADEGILPRHVQNMKSLGNGWWSFSVQAGGKEQTFLYHEPGWRADERLVQVRGD